MKKLVTTTVVAAVAFGALSACNSDENSNAGGAPNNETATVLNAGGVAKDHAATDTEAKAPAEPNYTMSQEQAIESAKSYLEMDGESRAGLIDQLSSKMGEGFRKADAVFAVNHIEVDWNKEAVQSAKSYLEMGGMSRAGLIDQLSSKMGEGFTLAQATYAANHVGLGATTHHAGAGSNAEASNASSYTVSQEQAIESAKSYLDMDGESRAGLIDQLSSKMGEGFRKADAVFAVNHVKVDWNKEAVQSAKSYLEMGGMSRADLIDQLSSKMGEGFTLAQATYAANHVGL